MDRRMSQSKCVRGGRPICFPLARAFRMPALTLLRPATLADCAPLSAKTQQQRDYRSRPGVEKTVCIPAETKDLQAQKAPLSTIPLPGRFSADCGAAVMNAVRRGRIEAVGVPERLRMRRLSIRRFRECLKIEAERATLLDEMARLSRSRERLRKKAASVQNTRNIDRISLRFGPLEDRNRELAEKGAILWHAVLALDAAELTDWNLLREQRCVGRGSAWLGRVMRHLAKSHLGVDVDEDVMTQIADLHGELMKRWYELKSKQEEHRWAQAEAWVGKTGFSTE
jgi:hypothetical protein